MRAIFERYHQSSVIRPLTANQFQNFHTLFEVNSSITMTTKPTMPVKIPLCQMVGTLEGFEDFLVRIKVLLNYLMLRYRCMKAAMIYNRAFVTVANCNKAPIVKDFAGSRINTAAFG